MIKAVWAQIASVIVALVVVIAPIITPAQSETNLTGDQIQAALSGNSITGKGFTLYYDPSGEVRGIEGEKRDKGKWWTKTDRMCVKWDKWMNSRELCMFLRQEGPLLHRKNTAGTYEDVVELREGNVKGL